MSLSYRFTAATFAACLAATGGLTTLGQTTPEAPESSPTAPSVSNAIPPIIVQASRTGRTASEMPANVQVITSEEIARTGYQNVIDVLQKQAGLPVKNFSDNPATATIALRGFGESAHGRVLILLNGERLNNPDMSAPNLMRIPLHAVKRIEVIRGPQTVLYGDFAETGVINIITDTSVEAAPVTTVSATVGSYDTYAAHISKSGAFEDGVTYYAGADWDKTGGYRDNGDYTSWSLDAAVAKRWEKGQHLSLSTFYHDSEYGLPGTLTWRQFKNDPRQTTTPNDRAWFETWGLNLGGGTPIGDNGTIDANLSASRREAEARFIGTGYSIKNENEIDAFAFTPRYTHDSDIANHANRLTLGTDLRYETSDIYSRSIYSGMPSATAWDFDRSALSAYAQDEFFLTESLSVTLGARAERIHNRIASNAGTTSYSQTEKAYEAALLYRPVENAKLFARASRYYHAPFIDETVGWSGIPNTSLTPETGYCLETGAEITFLTEWTAGITLYEMRSSDEIYYNPVTYMNLNAPDDTRRRGVETALRWSREHVGGFGIAYDLVDSRFTEGIYKDNDMPLTPDHMLTVNGEVYILSGLAALGTARYVSSQTSGSDFANQAAKLDDYATLDLALRYEPEFLKGLRLIGGVDNVFDKEYAYCGFYGSSYYPANGRTWKLCAAYTF
ncbi:MAG TPA: TonB-dependent receptor [Kiritimatiellia bacterium]|nr:TonB-dependent receptor [Kiritimatiellia bacterium]